MKIKSGVRALLVIGFAEAMQNAKEAEERNARIRAGLAKKPPVRERPWFGEKSK